METTHLIEFLFTIYLISGLISTVFFPFFVAITNERISAQSNKIISLLFFKTNQEEGTIRSDLCAIANAAIVIFCMPVFASIAIGLCLYASFVHIKVWSNKPWSREEKTLPNNVIQLERKKK